MSRRCLFTEHDRPRPTGASVGPEPEIPEALNEKPKSQPPSPPPSPNFDCGMTLTAQEVNF